MPNGDVHTEYERGYLDGLKRAEEIARKTRPAPQTRIDIDGQGMRNRIGNMIRKERESRDY